MDKYQIASLGCKFLGIYALIRSIPLLGNIFQLYVFASGEPAYGTAVILSTTVPFALMLLFACVLILFSNKFANKMVVMKDNKNSDPINSTKDFQSIAFSIIGLVFLLLSLPKIVLIGWNLFAIKSIGAGSNIADIIRSTWSLSLSTGVQFILGFILFFGSEFFSTLWHKSIKRFKYGRNIT